jgi:hypothetical protein
MSNSKKRRRDVRANHLLEGELKTRLKAVLREDPGLISTGEAIKLLTIIKVLRVIKKYRGNITIEAGSEEKVFGLISEVVVELQEEANKKHYDELPF